MDVSLIPIANAIHVSDKASCAASQTDRETIAIKWLSIALI
jgi:hypothetical protein